MPDVEELQLTQGLWGTQEEGIDTSLLKDFTFLIEERTWSGLSSISGDVDGDLGSGTLQKEGREGSV